MNKESNSEPYEVVRTDSYDALVKDLEELDDHWVYRAQYSEYELQTSLERDCRSSGFDLQKDASDIELNMIRQFSRVYDGDDRQKVQDDTLYCLSLMRHYGAPTRLLDFTYSKHVATYFALECAYDNVPKNDLGKPDYKEKRSCAIWCIKTDDLHHQVEEKYPEDKYADVRRLLKERREDIRRTDETFKPLYMDNKYDLVVWENPIQLHTRLHLQQGVFLCPGNIRKPFMDNLLYLYDYKKTDKIRKVICNLKPLALRKAFERCMRMNMTRQSLFPGLDGYARSMSYQFWLYKKLAKWRKR